MEAKITPLPSVGSGIDLETGITYPALTKGGYDLNGGVHFNECSDEWKASLSKEDKKKTLNILPF